MIVRRDRNPSAKNNDFEGSDNDDDAVEVGKVVKWVNAGSNTLDARTDAAAAA